MVAIILITRLEELTAIALATADRTQSILQEWRKLGLLQV
jgi:hypothetical protein